mgnify:CR=1 FL=1
MRVFGAMAVLVSTYRLRLSDSGVLVDRVDVLDFADFRERRVPLSRNDLC